MEGKKEGGEKIPGWQIFYDDLMLIFVIAVAIPFLTYIVWGLMDIANVPVAKP